MEIFQTLKAFSPLFGLLLVVVLTDLLPGIISLVFNRKSDYNYSKKKPTKESKTLCTELIKLGHHAESEKFDGFKHIDIAVTAAKLNIEVDGVYHNYRPDRALADLKRTFYSLEKGFVTIRIPNSLVKYKLAETVNFLDKIIRARINQVNSENVLFGSKKA